SERAEQFSSENFLRKRMWYLYIAKCADDTLYTGITTDVTRREFEHNTDNTHGAKSLRHKRPIRIVYTERHKSQSEARIREAEIKGWKRKYKLRLIEKFTVLIR
ncbi:MAG: GIY-YIG nuclease family protein, partial [Patescibacteria group bacterium]